MGLPQKESNTASEETQPRNCIGRAGEEPVKGTVDDAPARKKRGASEKR